MSITFFEPATAADAAAMLAQASTARTPLVVQGQRTKLSGRTDGKGARGLSTRLLTAGLQHYAGDLVATVPAGMTLHAVNRALAAERQWIPIDPPFSASATIGGIEKRRARCGQQRYLADQAVFGRLQPLMRGPRGRFVFAFEDAGLARGAAQRLDQ